MSVQVTGVAPTRRDCLAWAGGGRQRGWVASMLLLPGLAQAGQVEEPLADSVRSTLSCAIANKAPPVPEFTSTDKRLEHLRWLGAMSERLQAAQTRFPDPHRISANGLVRNAACRARHHHGDGFDPGGECLSQIRHFTGWARVATCRSCRSGRA